LKLGIALELGVWDLVFRSLGSSWLFPDFQGKGIGSFLLRYVAQIA